MTTFEKTIFLNISNGTTITSFLFSGCVHNWAKAGIRVVILAPSHAKGALEKNFAHDNVFFEELLDHKLTKAQVFIFTAIQAIYAKRKNMISLKLGEMHEQYIRGWKAFPRKLIWALSPQSKNFQEYLTKKLNDGLEDRYETLIEKYKPDLVFFNDPFKAEEMVLAKSCDLRSIKKIVLTHSWDNLTSRGPMVFTPDHLLVWNEMNRQEAIRLYDKLDGSRVSVMGIQLFDLYSGNVDFGSREDFFKEHGLDPNKKLITYSGITERACTFEAQQDIIEAMALAIKEGTYPPSQIYFRVHPKAIGGETLAQWAEGLGVKLHVPRGNDRFDDGWIPGEDELILLARTIAHSDVSVNMASTLLIHSAILDVPVICPRFDGNRNYPYVKSVRRGYAYEHNIKILGMDYAKVVDDMPSFVNAVGDALRGKKSPEENKKKLLDMYTHKLDGKTSERIEKWIVNYLDTF